MQDEATPDRRTVVLVAALGTAGLGTLGACAGSDSSTSSSTSSSISSSTSAPSSASSSAAPTGAAPPSSSSSPGEQLVALDAVPVGGSVIVDTPSGRVAVAQPTSGRVVAFSAVCTHAGCPVQPAGAQLGCPCHGSIFDAFTGKVVRGPAQVPLGSIAVKISGQDVVAG